jgi:hypothetical protein
MTKTAQKDSKTVEIVSQTESTNDKKILKKKGEKSSKKKDVSVEPEPAPIKEEVVEEIVEEVIEEVVDETPDTKKRIVINKESIMNSFDEIISSIENEISQIRDSSNKNKGIKLMKLLNRNLLLEQSAMITMNPKRIERLLDNKEINFFDGSFDTLTN